MPVSAPLPHQHAVLDGVSYATYERLQGRRETEGLLAFRSWVRERLPAL